MQKISDCGALRHKWNACITPFPPRLRVLRGRRGREIAKARGGIELQGNSVFWTQWGHCKKKKSQTAFPRPSAQARQIPVWSRGDRHKIPPLTKELLAFDIFWK